MIVTSTFPWHAWSSCTFVSTPNMPILCRHVQVYTLGRLSMVFFSFERVAQFNLEWIFSKLDSGFQSLVGFRILSAGFRIPKPRIPDSTSRKFLDSGIRIPLHGAKQRIKHSKRSKLFITIQFKPLKGIPLIKIIIIIKYLYSAYTIQF